MQSTPSVYAAKKISSQINVDGKADEEAWQQAPWSDDFVDIEGASKKKPALNSKVKMLWDDQHLYIYAQLEEPHVWGDIRKRDAIIYHNNDFEVFLKPFDNQPLYYEIEVNALNTVMDLMMPKAYRLGGDAVMHWDVKGLQSAVHVAGSINNANDTDMFWAVEMAIPFHSLTTFARKMPPKVGSYWRINFSRVQWQHEVQDNVYQRRKDGGKFLDEENWVWSPIGVINMHHPERWGFIKFVESTTPNPAVPPDFRLEQAAWNIFYLQQVYHRKNKQFATTIAGLPGYESLLLPAMNTWSHTFLLNEAKSFYKLTLTDPMTEITVSLDSEGNYHTVHE
ncbi:hypothetical protein GCM10017764_29280 [Sphingobacterium griseoflavum]|uniref:Carbohydrate-binding domain-containing protein n=2 Tax=Sphingobacterium griseoflavum TaxID=1474952 RepID=A0ABQ3HXD1_9SPHI|nr:hypothetical protein GCM10017764_29280 [Sphingobacterium griseoflavum]